MQQADVDDHAAATDETDNQTELHVNSKVTLPCKQVAGEGAPPFKQVAGEGQTETAEKGGKESPTFPVLAHGSASSLRARVL